MNTDKSFPNCYEGKQRIGRHQERSRRANKFFFKDEEKLKNICMLMVEADDQKKDEIIAK